MVIIGWSGSRFNEENYFYFHFHCIQARKFLKFIWFCINVNVQRWSYTLNCVRKLIFLQGWFFKGDRISELLSWIATFKLKWRLNTMLSIEDVSPITFASSFCVTDTIKNRDCHYIYFRCVKHGLNIGEEVFPINFSMFFAIFELF